MPNSPAVSDPFYLLLFWATFGAWGFLEASLIVRDYRAGMRGQPKSDRGSAQAVVAGVGIAIGAAFAAAYWLPSLALPGGVILTILGLALMWAGIVLRVWAVRTLGRFFRLVVMVQDGHHVVDSGPYSVLRHPSYSGSILTIIGVGVTLANAGAIVACAVLPLIGYAHRINTEEAALRTSLGDAYAAYSRRTKRLIPGIW